MRIAIATEPGMPGAVNLDWAGVAACGTAVVLDGLTEAGETGCRHGTAWYVRELGTRLLAAAVDPGRTLADALALALSGVAAAHGKRCDLRHPGSPGATVAIVRPRSAAADYLVLSDAVVVLDTAGGAAPITPTVITDRRVDQFLSELSAAATGPAATGPAATGAAATGAAVTGAAASAPTAPPGAAEEPLRRLIEAQQRLRNQPDGYWVARADPDTAAHALTGELPGVRVALLLSDGAALLASHFGALDWRELIDLAAGQGPAALIAATREVEARDRARTVWPRYKVHDDATAVLCDLRPLPLR